MPSLTINEDFDTDHLNALLSWLNPPANWRVDTDRKQLLIEPDANTDFWQRTHYGFRTGNGHLLKAEISGDAVVSARIEAQPLHQYDQAGVMVWFSDECWLKTSVEFEPDGASQLGAVVTSGGFSDWSMQDFHDRGAILSYRLRIRKVGNDFFVEYHVGQRAAWKLIRMAHLVPESGLPCFAGIYACSPKEAGFRVAVRQLSISATG